MADVELCTCKKCWPNLPINGTHSGYGWTFEIAALNTPDDPPTIIPCPRPWLRGPCCSNQPGSCLMINGKRVTVVLPAYNASATLGRTYREIPRDIVDDIILTDDASSDRTAHLARELGIYTIQHDRNRGYGGNQKTCYTAALHRGADIVVMLHPDYQYSPRLVSAMAAMIVSEEFDAVLGSRILGRGALVGGMPLYKYLANRALTFGQNLLIGAKLSEYHTGYRAWHRRLLERLPLHQCSDDFVFDNQMLVQAIYFGFRIGEISCPTRYFAEASSINLPRSVIYGAGVVRTSLQYRAQRLGLMRAKLFDDAQEARLGSASTTRTPVEGTML